MKIEIRKGVNALGGCVLEFATGMSRVLVDVGGEYAGLDPELPVLDGPPDPTAYDAVFLAQARTDRLGAVYALYPADRVHLGRTAYAALHALDEYRGRTTTPPAGLLEHGRPVRAGELTVVPYLADCASQDAFFLEVSAGTENVLYAGDFRLNGRKPFAWLLRELPEKVTALLCESPTEEDEPAPADATSPSDAPRSVTPRNEQELEYDLIERFRRTRGPILVLAPPTDADRLVSIHRAAKVSKRLLLEELQLAVVATAVGKGMPNPLDGDDVRTFVVRYDEKGHPRNALYGRFDGSRRIGRAGIAKERFVLCVRPSMLSFVRALAKDLPFADGLLVDALDPALRDTPALRDFVAGCEAFGLPVVRIGALGVLDGRALRKLVDRVHPERVIPIRSTGSGWFPNLPYGRGD